MKKIKEFLCFLIPFIVLSILSVIFFVMQLNNADVVGFMGGGEYLKLMLKDPTFVVALFNSYIPPVIIGTVLCAIYKVFTYALRKKISIKRNLNYIVLFLLVSLHPLFI